MPAIAGPIVLYPALYPASNGFTPPISKGLARDFPRFLKLNLPPTFEYAFLVAGFLRASQYVMLFFSANAFTCEIHGFGGRLTPFPCIVGLMFSSLF